MQKLHPIQTAALAMAQTRSEPGITFIDPVGEIPPEVASILPDNLRVGSECVRFRTPDEIDQAILLLAIERCDFTTYRLVAEQGKCMMIALTEIQKYFDGIREEAEKQNGTTDG